MLIWEVPIGKPLPPLVSNWNGRQPLETLWEILKGSCHMKTLWNCSNWAEKDFIERNALSKHMKGRIGTLSVGGYWVTLFSQKWKKGKISQPERPKGMEDIIFLHHLHQNYHLHDHNFIIRINCNAHLKVSRSNARLPLWEYVQYSFLTELDIFLCIAHSTIWTW